MRLGLSLLNFRPGRNGGTETYLRRLVAHLPPLAGTDTLVALTYRGVTEALVTQGMERVVLERGDREMIAARCAEALSPWRDRAAERFLAEARLDAVLFPQQSIFPLRAAVPAVLTVHDLQHLAHPRNLGAFDRAFRTGVYGRSMVRAARLLAVSRCTADEVVRRCAVSRDRVAVVPHGLDPPLAEVVPWRGCDVPYLYYPATTHPHKGHDLLFRALANLPGELAGAKLVLTGERTRHWAALARLARRLGVQDRVIHLGFVPRAQVESLYAGALAVVFPSRYEGFGLPVVEAAAHGKKVVTSRLPAFEELGVPGWARIDFGEPAQLARALAISGPTRLFRQPCSWADTAAATLSALRRAAGRPGEGPERLADGSPR